MSQAATAYKPGVISLDVTFEGIKVPFEFQKAIISIGRGEECDISLKNDAHASRLHAELRWNFNLLELHNVSSKNFVSLNGQIIQMAVLKSKDVFKVGDTEFYLMIHPQDPFATPPVAFKQTQSAEVKPIAIAQKQLQRPSENTVVKAPVQPNFQPLVKPTLLNQPSTFKPNPQAGTAKQKPFPTLKKESNPTVIILIVLLVGFVGWSFLKPNSRKDPMNLRSQEEIIKDIERSETAVKELEKKQEDNGKGTVQYKMAQEQYIKGFRDYRLGQYARAMQSFQAAVSFYPTHQLALKYLTMSKRKYDELIDFNLMQGHKYLSKNNYRLCKSSFANVMIMVKDPSDEKYKEGKQFYNECSAKLEDKY